MKKTAFKDKWGEETSAVGFIPFPSTLIFAQAELKLTPMEVNVLLNLLVHWWEKINFHIHLKSYSLSYWCFDSNSSKNSTGFRRKKFNH